MCVTVCVWGGGGGGVYVCQMERGRRMCDGCVREREMEISLFIGRIRIGYVTVIVLKSCRMLCQSGFSMQVTEPPLFVCEAAYCEQREFLIVYICTQEVTEYVHCTL